MVNSFLPLILMHDPPLDPITAYELLCNKKQRRMYDSVDEVDDSVPAAAKNAKQFFSSFPAAFERNER